MPIIIPTDCFGCDAWRSVNNSLKDICRTDLSVFITPLPQPVSISLKFLGCGPKNTFCTVCPYTSQQLQHLMYAAVWDAYAAGLWTSSTVIEVYGATSQNVGLTTTQTLFVGPNMSGTVIPATQSISAIVNGQGANSQNCTFHTLLGTVTIYDDGTFTLA